MTVENRPIPGSDRPSDCDLLFAEYQSLKNKVAQLWTPVLFVSYATVIFVFIAVVMVLAGLTQVQVASGAVALLGAAAVGALVTLLWKAQAEATRALNEYLEKCPDAAARIVSLGT